MNPAAEKPTNAFPAIGKLVEAGEEWADWWDAGGDQGDLAFDAAAC